jgi:hypothetical protein
VVHLIAEINNEAGFVTEAMDKIVEKVKFCGRRESELMKMMDDSRAIPKPTSNNDRSKYPS